jgi:polar amino acid transport system substrate-binding protein
MKKMRLVIILLLVLAVLSACAHTPGKVAKEPASPVIDRILQKGELVVGTAGSMPPLNMTTRDGEIIGLEADLARVIADAMGVKLRFEPMFFSELLPALEAGKIDIIMSGMTMTPQRNLKVAFVGPYFTSGKGLLTKIKTIASMKNAAEINSSDTTLAALEGSTSQKFVETLLPKSKAYNHKRL